MKLIFNLRVDSALGKALPMLAAAILHGSSPWAFAQTTNENAGAKNGVGAPQPSLKDENWEKAIKLLQEKTATTAKVSPAANDQTPPAAPSGIASDNKTLYSFRADNIELKTALALFARANNL